MSKYAKAIYGGILGFLLAFLSAVLPYLTNGGLETVTAEGWVTALVAGLASLAATSGVVYAVPNRETIE